MVHGLSCLAPREKWSLFVETLCIGLVRGAVYATIHFLLLH